MIRRGVFSAVIAAVIFGCASGPPELPYPAFIQVDDLDDVFMASLPGIRAKALAGDRSTRRSSRRIDLPADWSGTSGGSPGRSLELFVLKGSIRIADIDLGPGGYAFLPAGSLGFNLRSSGGAQILYFLNDVDPESVIRSPIIIDSALLNWDATDLERVSSRELRYDPGNGARTWLLKVTPGATIPWQVSSVLREGYLISGNYQHSECVLGEVHTWQYLADGYFSRPPQTINGGPEAMALTESVWLLRETMAGADDTVAGCTMPPTQPSRTGRD